MEDREQKGGPVFLSILLPPSHFVSISSIQIYKHSSWCWGLFHCVIFEFYLIIFFFQPLFFSWTLSLIYLTFLVLLLNFLFFFPHWFFTLQNHGCGLINSRFQPSSLSSHCQLPLKSQITCDFLKVFFRLTRNTLRPLMIFASTTWQHTNWGLGYCFFFPPVYVERKFANN